MAELPGCLTETFESVSSYGALCGITRSCSKVYDPTWRGVTHSNSEHGLCLDV